MMEFTEEQKALRLLVRLQGVIAAYNLPFDADFIRADIFEMGFQLRTESIPGPSGSFDQMMGFLIGYATRAREENRQMHNATDDIVAEAAL
jgi:hypothetical protein